MKLIAVQNVPQKYREVVREACERILTSYDDVLALVLIGSVAEGDFAPESDIDLVCVRSQGTPWKEQREISEQVDERIWLIFFTEETLRTHFQKRTTMAHSMARGMILYEIGNCVSGLGSGGLALPDRGWMKDWFLHWLQFYVYGMSDVHRSGEWHRRYCKEECHCLISDTPARAAVNLGILFLETRGVVPTTKSQIRDHFGREVDDPQLVEGLELALVVSREERFMTYGEAESVAYVATWLRDRLLTVFEPNSEDLERIERVRRIIAEAHKKLE